MLFCSVSALFVQVPPPSKQVRMLASGPSFPCQLVPRVRATYVVRSCVRLPRPGLARCCALRPRLPTSTYSRVQVRRQYATTPCSSPNPFPPIILRNGPPQPPPQTPPAGRQQQQPQSIHRTGKVATMLEYDDNGFYFFLLSALSFYLVPCEWCFFRGP